MATPLGSLIGGKVYRAAKYVPVMAMACGSMGAALLWLWVYVVETKPRRFDITTKQMFQEVFRLDNLKESYRTCVKARTGNLRLQIWLLVMVSFSLRLVNLGNICRYSTIFKGRILKNIGGKSVTAVAHRDIVSTFFLI